MAPAARRSPRSSTIRAPQPKSAKQVTSAVGAARDAKSPDGNTQNCKKTDLERHLTEALEREKALDEILRIMSSSPGDVQHVLDAVAQWTSRLCEAPFARVLLVDGNVLRGVASYSMDGTSLAHTAAVPVKRTSFSGRAVVDHSTIHHDDVVPLLESEYPEAVNGSSSACGTRNDQRTFSNLSTMALRSHTA